jgi:hypothetical protein
MYRFMEQFLRNKTETKSVAIFISQPPLNTSQRFNLHGDFTGLFIQYITLAASDAKHVIP